MQFFLSTYKYWFNMSIVLGCLVSEAIAVIIIDSTSKISYY
jgi:hypothetical protein